MSEKLPRIPFEIHESAEKEISLEKMQWFTNEQLVEFLNEATDHVLEVELHMGVAMELLKERGVDIEEV